MHYLLCPLPHGNKNEKEGRKKKGERKRLLYHDEFSSATLTSGSPFSLSLSLFLFSFYRKSPLMRTYVLGGGTNLFVHSRFSQVEILFHFCPFSLSELVLMYTCIYTFGIFSLAFA